MSDIRLIKYHPCAPHSLSLDPSQPPCPESLDRATGSGTRAPVRTRDRLTALHQLRGPSRVAWLAQGFPWPLALFLRGVDAGDAPARAAGLVPGLSASSSSCSSSALGTWP